LQVHFKGRPLRDVRRSIEVRRSVHSKDETVIIQFRIDFVGKVNVSSSNQLQAQQRKKKREREQVVRNERKKKKKKGSEQEIETNCRSQFENGLLIVRNVGRLSVEITRTFLPTVCMGKKKKEKRKANKGG
jgi:hypothetical protein